MKNIQIGTIWQRLEPGGDAGHDDNLLVTLSFQYHIPRRVEKEVTRPVFDRNLEKEF